VGAFSCSGSGKFGKKVHMNLGPGIIISRIVQPNCDDGKFYSRAAELELEDKPGACLGPIVSLEWIYCKLGMVAKRGHYLTWERPHWKAERAGRILGLLAGDRRRRSRDSGQAGNKNWPLSSVAWHSLRPGPTWWIFSFIFLGECL